MSQFGLAVRHWAGKQRDLGSNALWLSFLFKSCCLWTLSCDFVPHNLCNIKIAHIAAHLNAGVISFSSKVVVCGRCLVTLSLTIYETLK